MSDIIFEKVKDRGGAVNRTRDYAKQPSQVFFQKGVMRSFTKLK